MRNSKGGIQRAEVCREVGVEILIILAFAHDKEEDFAGSGSSEVADGLNLGVAKPLGGETCAKLIEIGRLGEAHIHVGAAFKVDPVTETAFEENRSPPGEEKNAT